MTRIVTLRTASRLWLTMAAALLLTTAPGVHAQSTDERLTRLERLLESNALLDISRQNDQLREEVQRLNGELEVARRELEELRRQQRSLYEDVDTRLQTLEQNGGSASSTATANAEPVLPDTPTLDADLEVASTQAEADADTVTPATENTTSDTGGDAESAYHAAFELLREGRYGAAGDAFRDVLEQHPGTRYADNARYWLGESYYVVRDFDAAMEHFQAVMDNPENTKQPDAMLKAGYIQYERGAYEDARTTLEQVRSDFPDSTVATLAENRLQRMRDEGR